MGGYDQPRQRADPASVPVTVLRRRPAQQDGETQARRRLDRAVAMLEHYQRNGLTVVSIEDMLGMLGTDPAQREPRPTPSDPRADPLTGALWPGPPGTVPPGS
jgi:hypothetical protein